MIVALEVSKYCWLDTRSVCLLQAPPNSQRLKSLCDIFWVEHLVILLSMQIKETPFLFPPSGLWTVLFFTALDLTAEHVFSYMPFQNIQKVEEYLSVL